MAAVALNEAGWTQKDFLAAQRRLQHMGLLDRYTAQPMFDRIQLFLLEALSFWWPSKKCQIGKGLPLSIPSVGSVHKPDSVSQQWVWSHPGEYTDGYVIKPLWPELPQLCMTDRRVLEFFSLVEILRFDVHTAKNTARQSMKRYLVKIQELGKQNFPNMEENSIELEDLHFEDLVNYICLNGFRSLTLQKASLITQLPYRFYFENWETDQALRLWVAGKYHDRVFQFLNPLAEKIHHINKGHLALVLETYLDYIESNEDYYRINLWSYLENDAALEEMSRRSQRSFFQTVLTLFKKSKPEAAEKAEFYSYLFTSLWRVYAEFIWVESKSISSAANLAKLKRDVRNFIVRTVFEDF